MNKARLLILAQILEMAADPKAKPKIGFNISTYGGKDAYDLSGHECGTVACIAGWAVAAFGTLERPQQIVDKGTVHDEAAHLLELDDSEAYSLFVGFRNYSTTPEEAAKVIRHAVKTNYIDWSVVDG